MESRAIIRNLDDRFQRIAYSRHEAAELLGISVESLDRLTRRKLLRPSRALRRPLYSIDELRRFLDETKP
jgi:DNA-binding transcriptional MerR regulator